MFSIDPIKTIQIYIIFFMLLMLNTKILSYKNIFSKSFNLIHVNKLFLSADDNIVIEKSNSSKRKRPSKLVNSKISTAFVDNNNNNGIVDRAKKFINFLDSSPEPFNCVNVISNILKTNDFIELNEDEIWLDKIKPNKKYFFTRNRSSIVAFAVGSKYEVGNGFKVIGAHTDSPNLKIKPNSKRFNNGLVQLNVECYGGGLWHTWFDRDLSLAGRVIIADNEESNIYHTKLVHIKKPVLRIPNLCIHLRSAEEREIFKINKEDHLMPILTEQIKKALDSNNSSDLTDNWIKSQSSELLNLLANELNVNTSNIIDFELSLYDTQNASFSGLKDEFIVGSRIDNLASCYVALDSFITYTGNTTDFSNDEDISMIAFFDHEEVGSQSYPGAGSTLMNDAITRITNSLTNNQNSYELSKISISKSMVLSVDMAHAIHPNYASKHDKHHAPTMNSGIVIKTNVNQRYSSNGITSFIIRELGRKCNVNVQEFSVRNDCPCGSTIGPIISANTGIRAVDLGMSQLSMHSIREMMGTSDLTYGYQLFYEFYRSFRLIDNNLNKLS